MKVLMLAPHPFYQPRGTPIAADLVLRVLSERGEQVDLITFPEGSDVEYNNVTIHRTPALKMVQGIRPGFSIKKIICDVFLLFQALRLAQRNQYDLVHAGEEAVFIALLLNKLLGLPYVYDMDSSLVQQLMDKHPQVRRVKKLLQSCEGMAVRNANAVLAVCEALKAEIEPYRPKKVDIIPDISLLNNVSTEMAPQGAQALSTGHPTEQPEEHLKEQLQIEGALLMYVGNLESYQGIDLLMMSFAKALEKAPMAHLVAIGGNLNDIQKYQALAEGLGVSDRVHFIGPRPVNRLKYYLHQADIVVSPRTQGNNTPMKLYSYLDSGKALLATNLTTHTQVLNDRIALLAEPEVEAFADGIAYLIAHPELRNSLGKAAQAYIAKSHTYEAFSSKLTSLYDWVQKGLLAKKPTVLPH